MKRRDRYDPVGVRRLLRALYRRQGGRDGITLKTILAHDPQTIQRCFRSTLSLDYISETQDCESTPFGEYLDSSSVVFPEGRPKTLIDQIHEKEILELLERVRREIFSSWRKVYNCGRKGTSLAVKVFDGLCDGDTQSEIARSLKISRERVRQVREQLKKLPVIIKMKRELRAMKSDGE